MSWAFLRTFIQLKTLQSVPKMNGDLGHDQRSGARGVAQSHALVESGAPA